MKLSRNAEPLAFLQFAPVCGPLRSIAGKSQELREGYQPGKGQAMLLTFPAGAKKIGKTTFQVESVSSRRFGFVDAASFQNFSQPVEFLPVSVKISALKIPILCLQRQGDE